MIVDHPHQLVDQKGLRFGALVAPGGALGQPPGDFRPALGQCCAQQFDHALPRTFGTPILHQIPHRIAQRAPIDDRALVGDPAEAGIQLFCSLCHTGR